MKGTGSYTIVYAGFTLNGVGLVWTRSVSLQIMLNYRPFLHPSITEVLLMWEDDPGEDISKTWFRKIYSFSKISETLILGWISGKEAEYMESLDNKVIAETCTMVLRKFLNDPFIPKPKSCVWYVILGSLLVFTD